MIFNLPSEKAGMEMVQNSKYYHAHMVVESVVRSSDTMEKETNSDD